MVATRDALFSTPAEPSFGLGDESWRLGDALTAAGRAARRCSDRNRDGPVRRDATCTRVQLCTDARGTPAIPWRYARPARGASPCQRGRPTLPGADPEDCSRRPRFCCRCRACSRHGGQTCCPHGLSGSTVAPALGAGGTGRCVPVAAHRARRARRDPAAGSALRTDSSRGCDDPRVVRSPRRGHACVRGHPAVTVQSTVVQSGHSVLFTSATASSPPWPKPKPTGNWPSGSRSTARQYSSTSTSSATCRSGAGAMALLQEQL